MNPIPPLQLHQQHIAIEVTNSDDTAHSQARHASASLFLPPNIHPAERANNASNSQHISDTVIAIMPGFDVVTTSYPPAPLRQTLSDLISNRADSTTPEATTSQSYFMNALTFLRYIAYRTLPSSILPIATHESEPGADRTLLGIQTFRHSFANFYIETGAMSPMERHKIEEMVLHSAIANSTYYDYKIELLKAERIIRSDASIESTSWERFILPAQLLTEMNLETLPDGRLYHRQSHLVVEILQNSVKKSVVMAFGGTTSGRQKGPLIYRLLTNPITSLLQWRRNLHSIGLHFTSQPVPDCYLKASEVAQKTNQFLKGDQEYKNYDFRGVGHSKGAAEAEFVTLISPSIPAFCFCTPPLSNTILKTIPPENFEQAANNIQHIFVQHDLAPAFHSRLTGILDASHIGNAKWLPAPAHVVTGPLYLLWAHDQFNESVMDYARNNLNQLLLNAESTDETELAMQSPTTEELAV